VVVVVVVAVVVAVRLAGAALIVVATPFTVVSTGVMVALRVPFASTETQGSRPSAPMLISALQDQYGINLLALGTFAGLADVVAARGSRKLQTRAFIASPRIEKGVLIK
jgi:hypothetical protein